jgi:hypothetical protein
MKLARLGVFIIIFALGWISSIVYSEMWEYKQEENKLVNFYRENKSYSSLVQIADPGLNLGGLGSIGRTGSSFSQVNGPYSPSDRVSERQIYVFRDKVILDIKNAEWASFTPTHSMEPVLNEHSNAIEVRPSSEDEIKPGDIIAYRSEYAEGTIIHRVIEVGTDEKGWFCRAKGDNNPSVDPGKIRFSQIESVVVAIIY